MSRIAVALVALVGLTAFAPAPRPREDRNQGLRLADIQGTWEVTSYGFIRPGKGHEPAAWIKAIRFKGDQLTFVTLDGNDRLSYRITIDPRQKPAALDLYWAGDPPGLGPAMHGVIRQQDGQIEFLYSGPPSAVARPTDFERPGVVCARVVLRRGNQQKVK
jgi:uncharacterized protein (TIGR03067 family)